MKILCIFLIFVFTVSYGLSVPQKRPKSAAERKRECRLVRGACKAECNTWEYVFTYCDLEPCCVVREYNKPVAKRISTTTQTTVNNNSNTLYNITL
ncbi:beta-defensin 113 [Lemur catta]|uniref:beta-defensin 113 n=1 Tax=Lemur catta TaxID=9447 RepID=UPI001E267FC1|nr:beta-defensin 113 [Lemur catta]